MFYITGKLPQAMTIRDNLQTIGGRIRAAEQRYGRKPGSVRLLAVSKKHPAAAIREALASGQTLFGESYAQELVEKANELAGSSIEWHFIGPIQSNKTHLIAETARWVHSVDRLKIAQRLSAQKPADAPDLNLCLQVNISGESSKSGVQPEALAELAEQVAGVARFTAARADGNPRPRGRFRTSARCLCASADIAGSSDCARFRAGYAVDGHDR